MLLDKHLNFKFSYQGCLSVDQRHRKVKGLSILSKPNEVRRDKVISPILRAKQPKASKETKVALPLSTILSLKYFLFRLRKRRKKYAVDFFASLPNKRKYT